MMNIGQRDQVAAASSHAETALLRHIDALPGGGTARDQVDPPAWFLAAIGRHNQAIMTGRGQRCQHVTDAPGLRVIGLWAPGLVLCARCAASPGSPLLGVAASEDFTCDRCREFHPEGLRVSVTRSDSTLIYFAVCVGCLMPD